MTSTISQLIAADVAGMNNAAARCRLADVLAGLDNTDRDAVLDDLTRPGCDERLARVLTRAGKPVAHSTVRRHRLGLCKCPTTRQEAAA